jgi:HrpA-like RNA helicase
MKVFEPAPYNTRKVIVSSNIAETGVTIEGVSFVVDCCLTKITLFDNDSNCDHLITIPASKANCAQRAGRAGRVKPGKCFRLCTAEFFETNLVEQLSPEIERCDPTELILKLKGLGVRNVLEFDYVSPPSIDKVRTSLGSLFALGALDKQANLTVEGEYMVEFNIDPRFTRAILAANSEDRRVADELISIAAVMAVSKELHITAGTDPFSISKAKKK